MTKRLIEVVTLNELQLNDLKTLVEICNQTEEAQLKFHEVNPKYAMTNILYYDDNQLMGYCCVTKSYAQNEVIIWGTLHPELRDAEHFEKVYTSVINSDSLKKKTRIKVLNNVLACEMKKIYSSLGAEYHHTTYEMKYNFSHQLPQPITGVFTFREALISDIKDLTKIGMEAFDTSESDEKTYNEGNLINNEMYTFLGLIEDEPIGMVSVKMTNKDSSIADLAVLKEFRNNGYGRHILSRTLDFLLSQDSHYIRLGVETKNEHALNIYKAVGFEIDHSLECFVIDL